jgi:geranylgeranyl diphosphate synthase type II
MRSWHKNWHEVFPKEIREVILAALPKQHRLAELTRFYRLLSDYPQRTGKVLRGQLLLLATVAHGGYWRQALTVAAALELFQNWVLIHDDIEDDSEERRGAPTLHKLAGLPLALNAGDALHVYMWDLLLTPPVRELPRTNEILGEFVWMIHRTAEGQHLDLSWIEEKRFDINEEAYLEMVTLKTAYYTVACPLRMGALCANREPSDNLWKAGQELGVAFQIRDDVLNLSPNVAYGKEFAGDLYEGKRTLILVHLFAHATADERLEMSERLSKPRSQKRNEDIVRILALIERYGSLAYAQEVADDKAKSGLGQLQDVAVDFPERVATETLIQLLKTLSHRDK